MSSGQLNSKTFGPVLLLKTIFGRWNTFLSSVATDGEDGHPVMDWNLKSFNATPAKITKKVVIVNATYEIRCGRQEEPAILISKLLLRMRRMYVSSIRLDFH